MEVLSREAAKPENHRYPFTVGLSALRTAVAGWYSRRFGVMLDPNGEVISVIGSKEGLSHIPLAFVNPGDVVLVPEPGYPVYGITSAFVGAEVHYMPLVAANNFLPDLSAIPKAVAERAALMFLNYPNNPTSASAAPDYFRDVVAFADKHNIVVCHDAAYSEVYYGAKEPASFLAIDGAREVGMEIHSLSKTFNMTGWRIGFAVEKKEIVGGLAKVKSNMDSGVFQPIQLAAGWALDHAEELTPPIRAVYERRRGVLAEALSAAGLEYRMPEASFYFWVKTPKGQTSERLPRCSSRRPTSWSRRGRALARAARATSGLRSAPRKNGSPRRGNGWWKRYVCAGRITGETASHETTSFADIG